MANKKKVSDQKHCQNQNLSEIKRENDCIHLLIVSPIKNYEEEYNEWKKY